MTEAQIAVRITDLTRLVCPAQASVREGLERINAAPELFQIVIDGDGRLLGTLTDGDVRRALLAGVPMDAAITRAMHATPMTARSADSLGAQKRLGSIRSVVPFLPLLDDAGRVVAVLVRRAAGGAHPRTALVMAGGRGSRLGQLTAALPKPLIEVNGKPMIEHVVAAIEAAGTTDVFVSVHYLAEQIESWCKSRSGSARLHVLREERPCGTAGALALLPPDIDGNVLVSNADLVTNVDLLAFAAFHEHLGTDATIAVARHEVDIPFGVVRADDNGKFLGIEEKPRLINFVSAGMYILGPEVRSLALPGRRTDMPELLDMARRSGLSIGVFPIHEAWRDVGRPADLEAASQKDEA